MDLPRRTNPKPPDWRRFFRAPGPAGARAALELVVPGRPGQAPRAVPYGHMATPPANNAPGPRLPVTTVARSPATGAEYVVRPARQRLPYGRGAPSLSPPPSDARSRDRPELIDEVTARAMLTIALSSKDGMLARPWVRVRRADTGAILVGPYRDRVIRYADLDAAVWALAGGFLLS